VWERGHKQVPCWGPPNILGITLHNSVVMVTWHPEFMHLCSLISQSLFLTQNVTIYLLAIQSTTNNSFYIVAWNLMCKRFTFCASVSVILCVQISMQMKQSHVWKNVNFVSIVSRLKVAGAEIIGFKGWNMNTPVIA
jgi:hypothetical protein